MLHFVPSSFSNSVSHSKPPPQHHHQQHHDELRTTRTTQPIPSSPRHPIITIGAKITPSFGEKSFDFDDWLEKKRPGRKHLDLTFELKIGAWNQSHYVLAVEYIKCLGIIAGGNNLETKLRLNRSNEKIDSSLCILSSVSFDVLLRVVNSHPIITTGAEITPSFGEKSFDFDDW